MCGLYERPHPGNPVARSPRVGNLQLDTSWEFAGEDEREFSYWRNGDMTLTLRPMESAGHNSLTTSGRYFRESRLEGVCAFEPPAPEAQALRDQVEALSTAPTDPYQYGAPDSTPLFEAALRQWLNDPKLQAELLGVFYATRLDLNQAHPFQVGDNEVLVVADSPRKPGAYFRPGGRVSMLELEGAGPDGPRLFEEILKGMTYELSPDKPMTSSQPRDNDTQESRGGTALVALLFLGGGAAAVAVRRRTASATTSPTQWQVAGAEHLAAFPLLCQMGNDGNENLTAGMPGRAQREYLKVLWYLAAKGLIDQYLLGKAYLGLMMTEARNPQSQLGSLIDPPDEGFSGPMKVVSSLCGPAHHVFKEKMLSPADQELYEALCRFHRKKGSLPEGEMSPWDLSLASADTFPVLHVPTHTVATVLDPKSPPALKPELAGQEIHIAVPGLDG